MMQRSFNAESVASKNSSVTPTATTRNHQKKCCHNLQLRLFISIVWSDQDIQSAGFGMTIFLKWQNKVSNWIKFTSNTNKYILLQQVIITGSHKSKKKLKPWTLHAWQKNTLLFFHETTVYLNVFLMFILETMYYFFNS